MASTTMETGHMIGTNPNNISPGMKLNELQSDSEGFTVMSTKFENQTKRMPVLLETDGSQRLQKCLTAANVTDEANLQ